VIGLTRSAALEYAPRGIRINAICLGTIETPMVADMIAKGELDVPEAVANQPIGRLGGADEIAAAVLGVALPVDGSYTPADLRRRPFFSAALRAIRSAGLTIHVTFATDAHRFPRTFRRKPPPRRTSMSIPDYIISRTIAEERQQRQAQNTPTTDLPEPRPRSGNVSDRFAAPRRWMSASLHTVADRIAPQPLNNHGERHADHQELHRNQDRAERVVHRRGLRRFDRDAVSNLAP
jgi:hypothetical protein